MPERSGARSLRQRGAGDVVYVNVLGRSVVILSSFKAVTDLLTKRAATYSDRPVLWMVRAVRVAVRARC